jgi:hypothetical protein
MKIRTCMSVLIEEPVREGDIHGVSSSDHLFTWSQDILDLAVRAVLLDGQCIL